MYCLHFSSLYFILFSGKIDVLYLDNTYCSPACRFPSRDDSTADIIDIIQSHPKHDIVLGLRSLGKETLLCKIAMTFEEWISVPFKFYETLKTLQAPDVFQNNDVDCRIRVEPFHKITNKFVDNLNERTQTLAILPTAIYCGIEARPFETNDKVYVVPYSDHSSYVELVQFVSFLKPCKIIPVVNGSARGPFGISVNDRADMSRFDKYLNVRSTTSCNPIPDTVMRYMKGKAFVSLENLNQGRKRKARKELRRAPGKSMKKGIEYEDSPEKNSQTENVDRETNHSKTELKETNHDVSVRSFSKSSTLRSAELKVLDFEKDLTDASLDSIERNSKDVDTGTDQNEIAASLGFHVTGETDNEIGESQGFIITGDLNSDNEEIVVSVESECEPKTSCSNHVETNTDSKKSFSSDVNNCMDENKDNSNLKVKKLRRKKIRRSLDFVSCSFEVHKSKRFLKENSPKLKHNDKAQKDNHYPSGNPLSCSSGSNSTEKINDIGGNDNEIKCSSGSNSTEKINDIGGNDNEIKSSPCSEVRMESEITCSDKSTSRDNSPSLMNIQGIHDSRETVSVLSSATIHSLPFPDFSKKSGNGSERIVKDAKKSGNGSERIVKDAERWGNGSERIDKDAEKSGNGSERIDKDAGKLGNGSERIDKDAEKLGNGSERIDKDAEKSGNGSERIDKDAEKSGNGSERIVEYAEKSENGSERIVEGDKTETEMSHCDKDGHIKFLNRKQFHQLGSETDVIIIEDSQSFVETDNTDHSTSSLITVGDSEKTLKADSQTEQKAKDSLYTIALKTTKTPWSFGLSECNRVKEKKAEIELKSDKDIPKKHVNDKKLHDTENIKIDEIVIEDSEEFSKSDKDNHKKHVNSKKLQGTENTKIDEIVIEDSEEFSKSDKDIHKKHVNGKKLHDTENTKIDEIVIEDSEEFSKSAKDNHKKHVNGKKLHDTENTKIDEILIEDSEPSGETGNTSHSENPLSIISDSERTSQPVLQIKEKTSPNSVDMLLTQTLSEYTAHSTQSGGLDNIEPVLDSNTELDNSPFALRTSKISLSPVSSERNSDMSLADEPFSCTVVTKTSKHSNPPSTDNGLRVLKWHPNMRKIRKQKFHKILTKVGMERNNVKTD